MEPQREALTWQPEMPKLRPSRLALYWIAAAISVRISAELVSGVDLGGAGSAFIVAALIAVLNALLPPVIAALRMPLALVTGFLTVLIVDAVSLQVASNIAPDHISVSSFGSALLAALFISAGNLVVQVILGTNDDDEYN